MNLKKHFLMAAAALVITTTAAQAQTKLAVVDLGKVFKEYWRTKQSDDSLKARASEFEKVGKGMQEDFKKAQEDLKTLQESANAQAVSQEERDKRKKELEKKGAALQELYASLQTFDRNARESLAGQQKRLRVVSKATFRCFGDTEVQATHQVSWQFFQFRIHQRTLD